MKMASTKIKSNTFTDMIRKNRNDIMKLGNEDWVIIINPDQESIIDSSGTKKISDSNNYYTGVISLKKDWEGATPVLFGEGIFMDSKNFTIKQLGDCVSLDKHPFLIKIAEIRNGNIQWQL